MSLRQRINNSSNTKLDCLERSREISAKKVKDELNRDLSRFDKSLMFNLGV